MRLETDHGKGVEAFGLQTAVLRYLVGILSFLDGGAEIGVGIFEGFVKFDDEILAESLLYASGVAGGIAAYHAALGNDFHHRAALVGIDTHIALRFGESEAEDAGAVGGGKLCGDVVVGQVDAVVMRKCYFGLVGEPRCARLFVGHGLAGHRHEREFGMVVDPGAGLVCLLETADLVRIVRILPAVAVLSGLWCPEVHAKGTGDGRVGVACRKAEVALTTHQRVHQRSIVLGMDGRECTEEQAQKA